MSDDPRFKAAIRSQSERLGKAAGEPDSLLRQTAYLGTLGVLLMLPLVLGVLGGRWLDQQATGYSVLWTGIGLLLGLALGAGSVFLFVRERGR